VPDLVTHVTVVLGPAALLPRRWLALASPLVIGAALPDLVSSVPLTVVRGVRSLVDIDERWLLPWTIFHTPVSLALVMLVVVSLARPTHRLAVALAIGTGTVSHLALDLLQNHHSYGYRLLFPLSQWHWELAWMNTEATVRIAPWLLLATGMAWAIRWRRERALG
jgi:hypothetical protein